MDMKAKETKDAVLYEVKRAKTYSNSILRVARYFWYVSSQVQVLALADVLQEKPSLLAVGVVDSTGKALGFVRREQLFSLIGKPFGRDVLRRSVVAEITETAESFNVHTDIFTVAVLTEAGKERQREGQLYYLIVDGEGGFLGLAGDQDIADYLARMTQDDIELAGKLQRRLLDSMKIQTQKDIRIEAWSRAAKGVGGDFYFLRELSNHRIFAALCDVSGKGVAASLIVSMVWGLLQGYDFKRGLRNLIMDLNRAVVTTFHLEKYLTGFFMIYDPAKPYILCADMGHSHVYLYRKGRVLSFHGSEGKGRLNLPIGVEERIDPALMAVHVHPGDILFCYSDGLTEQENSSSEEFGEERLKHTLIEALKHKETIQDGIVSAVDAFRDRTPQQDDMTFLVLSLESGSDKER